MLYISSLLFNTRAIFPLPPTHKVQTTPSQAPSRQAAMIGTTSALAYRSLIVSAANALAIHGAVKAIDLSVCPLLEDTHAIIG